MALIYYEARDIAICMRSLMNTLSHLAAEEARSSLRHKGPIFGGADGGSLDAERYSIDLVSHCIG